MAPAQRNRRARQSLRPISATRRLTRAFLVFAKSSPDRIRTLSETRYQKLARYIAELLAAADGVAQSERIEAYWRVGARIAREKLGEGIGYHNSILRDLAADSGLAIRTLQEAVNFHGAYAAPPSSSALSWSHYRLLAKIHASRPRNFPPHPSSNND